jgi:hypothetical protein
MKTFLPLTAAVSFAAFVILPVTAEIAISLSFAASLASIFASDYGRRLNPLLLHSSSGQAGRSSIQEAASNSGASRRERLRLAA